MNKKQIIKIDDNKFRIITSRESLIEEVSIGDIEGQIRLLQSDKELFENNNKSIIEKYNDFDVKIENLQNKIEEVKKVK